MNQIIESDGESTEDPSEDFEDRFTTESGFNDVMAQAFFDKQDSKIEELDEKLIDALEKYRSNQFTAINRVERGLVPDAWVKKNKKKIEQLKNTANAISTAISQIQLEEDLVAYRGIDASKNEELAKMFSELEVGDSYEEKSFSSTTLNQDVAFGKFSATENKGANIKILMPKGSNAMPMQNVGDEFTQADYEDEFEVLLDRNSKFEVVAKDGVNITVKLIQ